jgi:RNA-binding protein
MLSTVKNSKSAERFLQSVWNGMSELDKTEVYSSLPQRIDEVGTLFLRIDKQEALRGIIRIQDGDPIKIEFSFRAAPQSRGFVDRIRKKLEEI